MSISLAAARKLCTKPEFNLVQHGTKQGMKQLTPARLRQKVTRARTLREKYRDLTKQQRGEARGKRQAKGARPAQSSDNTRKKAEIFDELLSRFQQQLELVEASQQEGQAQSAAAHAKTARPTDRAKRRKKKHESTEAIRHQKAMKRASEQKIHGHVSSAGRRNQARRDSR